MSTRISTNSHAQLIRTSHVSSVPPGSWEAQEIVARVGRAICGPDWRRLTAEDGVRLTRAMMRGEKRWDDAA